MEKIIQEYLESNNSKSKSTKSTITQGLKRLEKILGKDFDDIKISDFKNVTEMLDKITDMYSLNTTISTILAINRFLSSKKASENLILQYREVLNELIQQRNGDLGKQKFKEGEEENWIDYHELKKQVEKLSNDYLTKKKSFTEYRNFLILSQISLLYPLAVSKFII